MAQTTAQPTQAQTGTPDGANSYKDASYDQLDAATSAKLNLPSWLLPAIRTQGEKSNNDQVSAAGAQTVYQITPQTRQLAIDKYGIDPYLSAGNASLVAGKLLQDSMQRNNGSIPQAIGEYIGGTDRSNWGKTTNAYIKRVLQGAGGKPQSVDTSANPYANASASADQTAANVGGQLPNANSANLPAGPSIAKLVDAFNSGEMDQQAAAEFQNDVNNGKVLLPAGVQLTRTVVQPAQAQNPAAQPVATPQAGQSTPMPAQTAPQPQNVAPQAVPLSVVQAYQSGQMDPQAKAEFEADLKAGKITLPQAQTPEQQGFIAQVGRQLGLFARDALQGVGNTVGLVYDPIAATVNQAGQALGADPHIGTAGGYAHQLADTLGLPTPQGDVEKMVNAATEAGIGGAAMAGGASALAKGATGAAQSALSTLGENPVAQTVAAAAGGGAQAKAAQAGAGPVGQAAANIGAAIVAPTRVGTLLARGAEALGQRVAPGLTARIAEIAGEDQTPLRQAAADVAQKIQDTPKDVAFDPQTGEVTKEGRELSVLSGLTPEGLRKAYGKLQTAAEGQVQNDTTALGDQFGIKYSKGQAAQDFATQDKEQTLLKSGTPEGDQARAFFDKQQEQVNQAVDNFRTGFGDPDMTPRERGQVVQDALRSMRNQGQAGVRALYKQAADMPGDPVPIDTQPIMQAAARVITEMPVEDRVKTAIQNTLAKYGVLGGDVTERGPFGNTVTAQGRSYQINGEVEPLTLNNAERMRQALNATYRADTTGHTGSVISALDDAVEQSMSTIAEKAAAQGAENVPGVERQQAFQQARAAAREQKQTYEAKDVIQDLTDYKNGTLTPKVLPENTFTPLFNHPSNLRKAKALLLESESTTPESKQAWKAIQAQALAKIAEGAKTSTGDYSAAKLNSAIAKFGDANLRTVLDSAQYSRLKSLQAAISKTQPMSGTVNYSNSFTKFANLIGSHLSDTLVGLGAHVAGAPGAIAGKGLGMVAEKIAGQRKDADILKGIVSPMAPEAAKARAAVDKANKDLIDQLVNASRNNAFVPYGITNSSNNHKEPKK